MEGTFQFNEVFINNYSKESNEGYFLEVDVQYPQKLHEIDNVLLFLPDTIKIEKVEKIVTNLHDKTEFVIHIKNLKKELNHGLIWKKD